MVAKFVTNRNLKILLSNMPSIFCSSKPCKLKTGLISPAPGRSSGRWLASTTQTVSRQLCGKAVKPKRQYRRVAQRRINAVRTKRAKINAGSMSGTKKCGAILKFISTTTSTNTSTPVLMPTLALALATAATPAIAAIAAATTATTIVAAAVATAVAETVAVQTANPSIAPHQNAAQPVCPSKKCCAPQ